MMHEEYQSQKKRLLDEATYWETHSPDLCKEYDEGIAWGIRHAIEILESGVPF